MEAKPVGIWIRVSTEDQAKGESPEHHEKRARAYAESKDWEVKEVYHLEAVSGKSVIELPETKRMLHDIRTGYIRALIFSKLARLARNTRELLEFSDIFREHHADLISLQEAIDTSTPAGRLFYTMIAAMAQWEREEIAERVAASVPIRAKLGKPLGGQAPFGYQWKDKKLVPDPQEAPIRKLLHELFLEHQRKKTVARVLNQAGHRTRNGAKFTDTTIGRLLRDSTAKGLHRANYTKSLGDNKKWVLKNQEDWVITPVEPIISEDLWDHCNFILDEQEKKHKKPTRKAVHLFTGVVYCHCNGGDKKMYVPSNSPKYICHKCRNKIGTSDLEGIFHQQLKDFFFSSEEVGNYLTKADQMIKDKEEVLNTLIEEEKKLRAEMDKIYRLYIDDKVTSEGFGERYKPMEERLKQINDQIPELQGEIDFLKIQYLSSDQILNEARDLYSRWPDLQPTEKRKIIENITDRIVINQDEIDIHLCYLPSPPEFMTTKQRNFIPALPFCHVTLTCRKQSSFQNPEELITLGDHLKKRRFELKLQQKDVANLIRVSKATVYNWEKNRSTPSLYYIPRVIEFLGYDPYDASSKTLGERIVRARRTLGMTQKELARKLGIDPSTLGHWERGKRKATKGLEKRLDAFFVILNSVDLKP